MKTVSAKGSDVSRDWFLVDATDKVLGRLASQIAIRLRGKHKAIYTPHVDTGDYVVVVNAEKVVVTGNKENAKEYFRHSGRPGGLTVIGIAEMRSRHPTRIIEKAVRGMMPKGPLGRSMMSKLKVYAGPDQPHQAQQLKELDL